MKRLPYLFLVLAVVTLGHPMSAATPTVVTGSALAVDSGVSSYSVTDLERGTPFVRLLGPSQQEVGQIAFDVRKPGLTEAHYTGPGREALTVYWQAVIGNLEIVLQDGTSASWRFDIANRTWLPSGAANDAFLARIGDQLRLVAVTSQDVLGTNPQSGSAGPAVDGENVPKSIRTPGERETLTGTCIPADYYVQGDWYDFRKSISCAGSAQRANEACTNRYCWGCCLVLPCDCTCVFQEFYCSCRTQGRPCARPVPTPPPGPGPCGGGGGGGEGATSGSRSSSLAIRPMLPCSCIDCPDSPCCSSPILIDLDGGGFKLTGTNDPVRFDLNANGSPEQTGWTERGSQTAFLVLDRNHNGNIDDGRELFGNHTSMPDGSKPANGYVALAVYDQPANGGNGDGRISADDAIWPRLQLWVDLNHNGRTDPGELISLEEAGVESIDLRYRDEKRLDRWGNGFKYRSSATLVNDRGRRHRVDTYDVYFVKLAGQ